MNKAGKIKLKQFLEDNIPFKELKKVGFFDKSIKKTDYEKIAERICWFFGLKNVYEYEKIGNKEAKWQQIKINIEEMRTEDKWLN